MSCLAADIGGTYSRFAWLNDCADREARTASFANAGVASLEDAISLALERLDAAQEGVGNMVLALPGPVHDDPVRLTNIDWQCGREEIQQRFAPRRLLLVNDFQAAAMGAVLQPYEQLTVLNAATPDEGPRVVAGAGTGLGMAWFAGADLNEMPQATEGGHMDFAPGNPNEARLHAHLTERFGHVSYERILSGDGLLDTYRHIAGQSAPLATPAAIVDGARAHDRHAAAAIALFADILAGYAGNLALAFNPTGGIYLCGGLLAHLSDWLTPTIFRNRYAAKGRMSDFVKRIPVFLTIRHDTGLVGAINIARILDRADT